MTSIILPIVSRNELQLQELLSHHQHHFHWQDGDVHLAIATPKESMDTRLLLHWQGLSLALRCKWVELANWLVQELQQASLQSLPESLQLALINHQCLPLPGLISSALSREITEPGPASLHILLQREGATLSLWLAQPNELVARLPHRSLTSRLPFSLSLTLLYGSTSLTMSELASLKPGDILLLPPQIEKQSALLACLEGQPFALCQINQNHLELTTMLTPQTSPLNPGQLETLPVQVSFEVGRQSLEWHVISTLQPGSLIDLNVPLDGEVRIVCNGRQLGTGRLVDIQGRLGVRIENLCIEPQA